MKRKLVRPFILALCVAALLCAGAGTAFADAGGFSGSMDFGGGFSGGGSGDGEALELLLYLILWLIFDVPGGWIIALIILAVIIVMSIVGAVTSKRDRKKGGKRQRVVVEDTFDTGKLRPAAGYCGLDPNFDADALCEKASDLYVRMQNAWTAKDFEVMRPHFSDTMFSQLDRQLDSLKNRHQTNYVEDIAVLGVMLEGWYQENGQDCMAVKLRTRIVDYTLDDNTGRLISGSKTDQKFMTYRWILTRTSGYRTEEEGALHTVTCPNCAAALQINKTARCPYCDSVITVKEHDWVINSMQGLSQTTA